MGNQNWKMSLKLCAQAVSYTRRTAQARSTGLGSR